MVKIPDQIRKVIDKYICALEEQRIHIRDAILFGSYADGNVNEWSDIDIALVSESFGGDRFDNRSKIRKITLSVSSDLSPMPFRPEDFISEELFNQNKHFRLIDLLIRPLHLSFKMYILKFGFLDGFQGFVLALCSGFYVFVKYAKLWELQRQNSK